MMHHLDLVVVMHLVAARVRCEHDGTCTDGVSCDGIGYDSDTGVQVGLMLVPQVVQADDEACESILLGDLGVLHPFVDDVGDQRQDGGIVRDLENGRHFFYEVERRGLDLHRQLLALLPLVASGLCLVHVLGPAKIYVDVGLALQLGLEEIELT